MGHSMTEKRSIFSKIVACRDWHNVEQILQEHFDEKTAGEADSEPNSASTSQNEWEKDDKGDGGHSI